MKYEEIMKSKYEMKKMWENSMNENRRNEERRKAIM